MGSPQGSQPDWEKPEIVELDAADAAAGTACNPGSSEAFTCLSGPAATSACENGSGNA